MLDDDTLARVGERNDKTRTQVALRWFVQQPNVAAIPRSSSPDHVEQNAAVFDSESTETGMQTIHDRSGGLSVRLRNKRLALLRSFPL